MRFAFALVVVLAACSDDNPGPDDFFLIEGTWTGFYVPAPGDTVDLTLELLQDEADVFGTLTTSEGREAEVIGTLAGRDFTGTLTYLDACGGTGTTEAELVDDDQRLVGAYTTTGACEVQAPVEYDLVRQGEG